MDSSSTVRSALLVISAALAVSCSSTKIKQVWRSSGGADVTLRRFLVIGVDSRNNVRHEFEDAFTARLVMEGIPAAASYSHFTLDELEADKDEIRNKVAAMGYDGVLVTRLIDREKVAQYYNRAATQNQSDFTGAAGADVGLSMYEPFAAYRSWTGYYSLSYNESQPSGQAVVGENVRLETNLYEVESGELRWSALSETFIEETATRNKEVQALATALVNRLKKEKFMR